VTPSDSLFERSDEYAAMLERGLRYSGENRDHFIAGRVSDLRAQLREAPNRILDFGCGTGDTAAHLARVFPEAQVLGVDDAGNAVAHAARVHGSERVRFGPLTALEREGDFDLCYANGVFHHIAPPARDAAVRAIAAALRPGGRFALFENNPWNPGTRLVMRAIPFDRDAVPIAPPEARALLARGGFEPEAARFLFWFPRWLAPLRALEPALVRVPLGAQYYFLATKR
jgi:SAM-dependent methyltransferase